MEVGEFYSVSFREKDSDLKWVVSHFAGADSVRDANSRSKCQDATKGEESLI